MRTEPPAASPPALSASSRTARTYLLGCALNHRCDEATAQLLLKHTEADLARQRTADTLHRHGLALLRAGRIDEAAKVLAASIAAHGRGGFETTQLFLSIALRQQGQFDQADRLLAKVEAWHSKQTFADWQTRASWDALLHEARSPPPMRRVEP